MSYFIRRRDRTRPARPHQRPPYRPAVEALEGRCLLAAGVAEFPIPTAGAGPVGITAGPDGNLWFTENATNQIGHVTPAGTIQEFPIVTSGSDPAGITAGPDGNLWFTEQFGNKVGRITPAGSITEFAVPTANATLQGITAGPDGNLWFVESQGNKIGRVTPSGTLTEFSLPAANSRPQGITAGPDGALWFTESQGNKIGRMTTAGAVTGEFALPTPGALPQDIVAGPDGNLWFTESAGNKVGKITPAGAVTEFAVPTAGSGPQGITKGPDGNLWFTEAQANQVGRVTPAGVVQEVPGLSPSSVPFGITTGPDGNLWLAERDGDRIARLPAVVPAPPLTPSQQFVEGLYRDLLGRDAEPAGQDAWAASLDKSQFTRAQASFFIGASAEGRARQVQNVYQMFLHRPADPSGLGAGVQLLLAGHPVAELQAIVLGSAEYFQARGGGSNDGLVAALYQDVLGRAPDSSGQAGAGELLAKGGSREQLALVVLLSLEADQAAVQALYGTLLHHPADPGQVRSAFSLLAPGVAPRDAMLGAIVQTIFGSPEYAAAH